MGANRFLMASVQNLTEQTNGTTTYANVDGLAIDLDPLDQLTFRFMVLFKQSVTSDSMKIQLTAPANPVVLAYDSHIFNAASVNAPLAGTVVPQADTPYVSWTQGYLENGVNAGSLQAQFASASGAGTVTILKNCNAVSWRVFP